MKSEKNKKLEKDDDMDKFDSLFPQFCFNFLVQDTSQMRYKFFQWCICAFLALRDTLAVSFLR